MKCTIPRALPEARAGFGAVLRTSFVYLSVLGGKRASQTGPRSPVFVPIAELAPMKQDAKSTQTRNQAGPFASRLRPPQSAAERTAARLPPRRTDGPRRVRHRRRQTARRSIAQRTASGQRILQRIGPPSRRKTPAPDQRPHRNARPAEYALQFDRAERCARRAWQLCVKLPAFSASQLLDRSNHGPLVVAAGLQDPGNLGTILRSAEAFGAAGIFLTEGTVSPYNSKVLRGSAGSIFRLPFLQISSAELIPLLRARGVRLLATSSHQGTPLPQISWTLPLAIFIGNEGAGLSRELARQMDETLAIPQARKSNRSTPESPPASCCMKPRGQRTGEK